MLPCPGESWVWYPSPKRSAVACQPTSHSAPKASENPVIKGSLEAKPLSSCSLNPKPYTRDLNLRRTLVWRKCA